MSVDSGNKKKMFRVGPKGYNKFTTDNFGEIEEWLKESEEGTINEIETIYLTQEEFDKLPEYMGP